MLKNIIALSVRHKAVVLIGVMIVALSGLFALLNIPIGAVPDVTNNQVQVITTSRHLAAEDVERFLTYPVELQMSNLPGVVEIRSISKFGLSVVTIVFEEDMGTYLPRQLIAEKLVELSKEIPESFGTPAMAPISTGLGEIYQYTLNVAPEYKHRYTLADIRGIQDWIVKRQLSGIPGVVEVNTWGGHLKTFEIIADPKHLFSLDLSLTDIYEAVTNSASIEGGGYIEKDNEAHFLRFEGLLKSIEDIENIVVQNEEGVPLFIKDIATVKEGYSTRFGAITGNGEGEKVLGQVMMLKGANSQAVINKVRERVEEVQSSLPLGISIDPIVDRSELISRTTWTITENLILAFVIVFLVVVFLMGNLRAGVIVASVVPLTLLMALGLMYIFKIDANLMSLGAIDFGIIIDGAVIIVEYISLSLMKSSFTPSSISQFEKDKLTIEGTDKMLHSAIFGQIIILVVFIPILTLTGVEGKMFRPMALTFCFAVISAILLCFTYVPVLAALLLQPGQNSFKITETVMTFLREKYEWIMTKSMQAKSAVLLVALTSLIGVGILFSTMGGEFIPTLDEGDFVIQPVLKTGMSLKETVAMTTRIEKILLEFSEVKSVVSRIGAAEVPTDPMSMEESDVIIALHPPGQWENAQTKDDLADLFKSAIVADIPGIEVEFTQPIEMRFNELITGVRADIAIKVFGENLDTLFYKGVEIQGLIQDIKGAADISVEKIDGLPQMLVSFDRGKLGLYGLSLNEVNSMVGMAFGGRKAGQLYQGERQHDVVVRYPEVSRNSIGQLKSMMIPLKDGGYIPLEAVAEVKYSTGPAKISRDDTKRRVVVGINVRGSDLATVVTEVRQRIEDYVSLPPGYSIDYSGQFENLEAASTRLKWAVPVALFLIFIFLFFAFNSMQYALIIFTAIPLATIGGILGLYLRGMPFSISAGVGFIALFGIAVLNGIVMIEHFITKKPEEGMITDKFIIQMAKERLRPVLLTAMAAAMGFLPMALSTSAGAEVQRPLATVVVMGLISSTILTLIILPIIYSLISKIGRKGIASIAVLLLTFGITGNAQPILDAGKVIQNMDDHPVLEWTKKEAVKAEKMIEGISSFSFPEIYYSYDENNATAVGQPLHVFGIEKSGKFSKWIRVRKELQEQKVNTANAGLSQQQFALYKKIYGLSNQLEYLNAQQALNLARDSLVRVFADKLKIKKENGQIGQDEVYRLTLDALEISSTLSSLNRKIEDAWNQFYIVVQDSSQYQFPNEYLPYDLLEANIFPQITMMEEVIREIEMESEIVKSNFLPEWRFSLFGGSSNLNGDRFYPGLETGISFPLSSKAKKSTLAAVQMDKLILQEKKTYKSQEIALTTKMYKGQLSRLKNEMDWYQKEVFPLLDKQSQLAYKSRTFSNTDVLRVLTLYEQEYEMQMKYLELIYEYNNAIIELAFPIL